jgi:hypothetical protein
MVKLMNLNPTENCFETRYHPSFLVLTGYVRERGEEESGDGVHLFFS